MLVVRGDANRYYVSSSATAITRGVWTTASTSTTTANWLTVSSQSSAISTTDTSLVAGNYIIGGSYYVTSNFFEPMSEEQRQRMLREDAARKKQYELEKRTRIHRAKSALKRVMKLVDNVGFGDDVRVFLGGSEIEISHPDSLFKFVISKSGNLIERTARPGYSVPYKLHLYTKSGIYIADLCAYMADTPVLDQILAVSMFIKSGSEDRILNQANWRFLTDDIEAREILALEYPELAQKLRVNSKIYTHVVEGVFS